MTERELTEVQKKLEQLGFITNGSVIRKCDAWQPEKPEYQLATSNQRQQIFDPFRPLSGKTKLYDIQGLVDASVKYSQTLEQDCHPRFEGLKTGANLGILLEDKMLSEIFKIPGLLQEPVNQFLQQHELEIFGYTFNHPSIKVLDDHISAWPFIAYTDSRKFCACQLSRLGHVNHGYEIHWDDNFLEISVWNEGRCFGYYLCCDGKEVSLIDGSTGALYYKYPVINGKLIF